MKPISFVTNNAFKQIQLASYFGGLLENPSGVRTLADLIAFDDANPALEEPTNFTDQSQYVLGVNFTLGETDGFTG